MPANDHFTNQHFTNQCGTLSTTPSLDSSAAYSVLGGNVSSVGYSYTYPYPYGYPFYPTYDSTRVSELETKVEMLEKMLAAVLSGRPAPKRPRK